MELKQSKYKYQHDPQRSSKYLISYPMFLRGRHLQTVPPSVNRSTKASNMGFRKSSSFLVPKVPRFTCKPDRFGNNIRPVSGLMRFDQHIIGSRMFMNVLCMVCPSPDVNASLSMGENGDL